MQTSPTDADPHWRDPATTATGRHIGWSARIRRGFRRLGILVAGFLLLGSTVAFVIGLGQGALDSEPGAVALFLLIAAVLAFAALEGLGWVVAGFLDD